MFVRITFAVAAGALALVAGCSSTSSNSSAASSSSPTTSPAAPGTATVDARTGPLGSYLVDSSGMTLYYFAADTKNTSHCYGVCAAGWPVLAATGTPTAGPGVNAAELGTITRADGTKQVTYDGLPLYHFVLDAKPGDIFGQALPAFGAPWWLVNPASGQPITGAPPALPAAAPPAAPSAVTITAHHGPLGTYLTDSAGKTLYMFDADSAGKSNCAGLCAEVWPPVLISGTPTAGSGIQASLLGTIKRADGTTQVTYDGHPLYYFALDGGKPGVTNGQGQKIGGAFWWVLAPSGKVIPTTIPANGPAAPAASPSTSSGGYGY